MVEKCMLSSVCTNSSWYCELKELVKIDFFDLLLVLRRLPEVGKLLGLMDNWYLRKTLNTFL